MTSPSGSPYDAGERGDEDELEALVDIEVQLVKAFNWSLHEIDETDIASMMDFIGRLTGGERSAVNRVYADQVNWL